jgi:hypothetical protein
MIAALNYIEVTRLKQKLPQTKIEQANSLFYLSTA